MSSATPGSGREVRLLLATMAISLVTLLLLARLRFPAHPVEVAEPAPAPLERLAAEASYDELASSMAELDRRIRDSLMVVRVRSERRLRGSYAVATRMTPDRAVVFLDAFESLVGTAELPPPTVLFRDRRSGIAVLQVDALPERVATPRSGAPRPGPRYVAVVDATAAGPSLRPLYVGSTTLVQDPSLGGTVLSMSTTPQLVPPGTPVFTLAGAFAGIATASEGGLTIVPGDVLRTLAEGGPPPAHPDAEFGVRVQPVSASLARIAGASDGVVVSDVETGGPADGQLQPGDVVQSIDGTAVSAVDEFTAIERNRAPGTATTLAIVRRGQPLSVQLVPREVTAIAQSMVSNTHGLKLRTVTGSGAEVLAVASGSAGAAAGLEPGDLITSIDGHRAPTAVDLDRAFAALGSDQGQTRVRPGSDRGQTGVRPGSDQGQTGVRPGSDPQAGAGAAPGLLLTVQRDGDPRVIALEKR